MNKSEQKSRNLQAILKVLSPFEVVDFDSRDAWEYGEVRAELESKGKPIGGNDMMIAAQARRRDLIVITNNTREYKRVEGLKVQDWIVEKMKGLDRLDNTALRVGASKSVRYHNIQMHHARSA